MNAPEISPKNPRIWMPDAARQMNTDPVYSELLRLITKRLDLVADRGFYHRDPAGHLEALRDSAKELELLAGRLPPDAPPVLKHYLERQSLAKAADFLRDHTCVS